jgi:hypothetical protein
MWLWSSPRFTAFWRQAFSVCTAREWGRIGLVAFKGDWAQRIQVFDLLEFPGSPPPKKKTIGQTWVRFSGTEFAAKYGHAKLENYSRVCCFEYGASIPFCAVGELLAVPVTVSECYL